MGKAEVIDKYLFVNDIYDEADEDEFGTIYVYELKFNVPQLNLLTILNSNFFDEDEPFEIHSFEVLPLADTGFVRLLVGDTYMKLISADIPQDA